MASDDVDDESSEAGEETGDVGGGSGGESTPQTAVQSTRRALATVFAIVFVDLLGFGILIPIIPLYAESFGASEFVVGLLIASYSLFQFVGAPILGRLSDERGRRPVLLISLAGSVIAWTLFGLAHALWVLFLARILAGLMGGNIATAQAYIADVTPPEDRVRGLGLLGAAFGLGFVFGPALGGVFSDPGVVAATGEFLPDIVPITTFTLPSFLAAAITALNLLGAALFLPETHSEGGPADDRGQVERLRDAVEDPAFGGLIVAFFVFSLAFSGMESMFVLFTNDIYGYGPAMNGYLLAYVGVIIAIVQGGLVGPVSDRFGEVRLALGGAGIELVSLAALPFAPAIGSALPTGGVGLSIGPGLSADVLALALVMTALAAGNGFTNVSLNTLVSKTATADTQGGAFGLTQSAGSLARTGGPIAAGALYTQLDYRVPFVCAGLVMLPIIWILLNRAYGGNHSATTG